MNKHELKSEVAGIQDANWNTALYRRFRDENKQCLQGKVEVRVARLKARFRKVPDEAAHCQKAARDNYQTTPAASSVSSSVSSASNAVVALPQAGSELTEREPTSDSQETLEILRMNISKVETKLKQCNSEVQGFLSKLKDSRQRVWNEVVEASITERRLSLALAERKTGLPDDRTQEIAQCESSERELSKLLCKAREAVLQWAPIVTQQRTYITDTTEQQGVVAARKMFHRHPAGDLFMPWRGQGDHHVVDSGRFLVCDDSNGSTHSSMSSCDTDDLPLTWGETTYDESMNRHLVPKLDLANLHFDDSESGSEDESVEERVPHGFEADYYDEAMDVEVSPDRHGGCYDEAMGSVRSMDGIHGSADVVYHDGLDDIEFLDPSGEWTQGMLRGLQNGKTEASKGPECSGSVSYEDDFEESSGGRQSQASEDELS